MTLPQNNVEAGFAAPGKIVVATDLTDTEYLLPHAIAQAKAGNCLAHPCSRRAAS